MKALKAANERLRERVAQACQHVGVTLDEALHCDITSGLLQLTSERTLRDYTHFIPPHAGFQDGVPEQLTKEAIKAQRN